jgi:hypothetical protein
MLDKIIGGLVSAVIIVPVAIKAYNVYKEDQRYLGIAPISQEAVNSDYLLPVKSGLLKVNKELDSTRCASASEEDMTKVIANANKWDLEYNGDKCKKFNLGMPTDSDGNFCLRGANTVSDKDRETIYLRCK